MRSAEPLSQEFLRVARRELSQSLIKIQKAVAKLSPKDLWSRSHEDENSVGNLLLHLSGNVRQWLISGLGGGADDRDRDAEFAQREAEPAKALLEHLGATLSEADAILAALTPEQLLAHYPIQGFDVTGLYAVFHVVEHFGEHTGQILWIAKNRSGGSLNFHSKLTGGGRAAGGEPTVE